MRAAFAACALLCVASVAHAQDYNPSPSPAFLSSDGNAWVGLSGVAVAHP